MRAPDADPSSGAGGRRRVQMHRGLPLPHGSRSVARGSRWGNPFRCPPRPTARDRADAAARYAAWIAGEHPQVRSVRGDLSGPQVRELALARLAEFDLACYCPADQPCHADVLLRLLDGQELGAAQLGGPKPRN